MTDAAIKSAILECLSKIAPEADLAALRGQVASAPRRDELDILRRQLTDLETTRSLAMQEVRAPDELVTDLVVPGHHVGDGSLLMGGRPPSAVWRRSVL